jgi:hypothetical protein
VELDKELKNRFDFGQIQTWSLDLGTTFLKITHFKNDFEIKPSKPSILIPKLNRQNV